MNVKEILKDYLVKNGFDGLCHDWMECGCEINDLCPCLENDISSCEPAYKTKCNCEKDVCGWHMTTEKPKEQR